MDITMAATPPMIPAMFQLRAFLLYSTAASWLPDSSAVLACKKKKKKNVTCFKQHSEILGPQNHTAD